MPGPLRMLLFVLPPRPLLSCRYNSFARLGLLVSRHSHTGSSKPVPLPPRIGSLESPEENDLARAWIAQFARVEIPKGSVQLSFSRSSGPGGQNVNKVNTKATLRCPIHENWIPMWATDALKRSPHYISSTQSIQITSTVHRSQSQNIEECLSKFHALLLAVSSSGLKNEPSEAQRKRVEELVKASNAKRRTEKSRRSSIKAGRKGPPPD
ncbi:RF-1 domain-containing protein [Mycena galericulata]|nr:RF-1 domain-containing protein [Mycena galericulata]